jgi:UDP-N-acetylglucosamine:LPS N-acetylglucosamine transferase
MQAISDLEASVRFEIFTTVPTWFFTDSVSASFTCHGLLTDIGLEQVTAFQADLNKTLLSLNHFFPIPASRITEIAAAVNQLKCRLVICDIAPLGISVAIEAGIPSVLVENFTWDWIYEQYSNTHTGFKKHIKYLRSLFQAVNYHIKTEPVCCAGSVDLTTSPVSRQVKISADRVRKGLGLTETARMVLVTTGGIKQSYDFLNELKQLPDIHFVMPGAGPKIKIQDNCIILPHRSDYFHPDLVNASDAVVGKVGYSTLAEVYHAGVPFGYVARSNFRESKPITDFIEEKMQGISLKESDFNSGMWTAKIRKLLNLQRVQRNETNGAEPIGRFVRDLLLP